MWPAKPGIIAVVDTARQKLRASRAGRVAGFVLEGLGELFWPAVCINCGGGICQSDNYLCGSCWEQVLGCTGGDYCRRCGRDCSGYAVVAGVCPGCQGEEINFDRMARSGVYSQALQRMILAFKRGRCELDLILGFFANAALQGSEFVGEIDFFVPVPLHWRRRLVRGYNQSLVLAKQLKQAAAKIDTDLVRVRHTKWQPMMASPAARARNVAGAFAVRRGHRFAGKVLCLVDDIKTTGATLNECAGTLKLAGASKVFALVLTVAGQRTS